MARTSFLITTTSRLDGYTVDAYLGPVSEHVVAGTNIFSDIAGGWSDFFGGRSKSYQKQLAAIKQEALHQLEQRARAMGANAIVGLSIDLDEISGQGKSMFMVTVLGTAVQVTAERGGEATIVSRGRDVVEAEDVRVRAKQLHMLEDARMGRVGMSDRTIAFTVQHQFDEIVPVLLEDLAKHPPSAEYGQDQASRGAHGKQGNIRRILDGLRPDTVRKHLEPYLEHENRRMRDFAHNVLDEADLVFPETVVRLLRSTTGDRRKDFVRLAESSPPCYTRADLDFLREIKEIIESDYPSTGRFFDKEKMIGSGSTRMYECSCGRTTRDADFDKHCPGCGLDRRGFSRHQVSPDVVLPLLQRRIEALQAILTLASAEAAAS